MMKKSEVYKKLRKRFSDEEIVDGYIFSDDEISASEQEEIEKEFRELRLKQIQSMSEEEKLYGKLMKIKFRMLDYFEESKFDKSFSFAKQLKEYFDILNISNKAFASDIGIHHTKFSRIVNGKENPNIGLMYRLEEHSNGELPAHYWWRLYSRELEHIILTDLEKRVEESKKVTKKINIRA